MASLTPKDATSVELQIPPLSATNPINGSSISSVSSSTSANAEPRIKSINPLPHRHHKETNDRAVREAKAEIRSKLREDWEYPLPPSVPLSFLLDTEGVRWVERESDSEPPSPTDAASHGHHHRWDNPEPFARAHQGPTDAKKHAKKQAKKQKRLEQTMEEMVWNEGLRHWIGRRDAWTAAQPPLQPSLAMQSRLQSTADFLPSAGTPACSANDWDAAIIGTAGCSLSPPMTAATISPTSSVSISGPASSDSPSSMDHTPPTSANPSTSSLTAQISNADGKSATTIPATLLPSPPTIASTITNAASPPGPSISPTNALSVASPPPPSQAAQASTPPTLIPISPPLLPLTNPVRASITPKTYPSLYSKIAIQALTPTIPINLADMVRSLVVGWKRDGEWPSRQSRVSTTLVHKPWASGARGQSSVAGGVYQRASWEYAQEHTPGKVVRRSVGRVKKALGIGSSTAGEDAGAEDTKIDGNVGGKQGEEKDHGEKTGIGAEDDGKAQDDVEENNQDTPLDKDQNQTHEAFATERPGAGKEDEGHIAEATASTTHASKPINPAADTITAATTPTQPAAADADTAPVTTSAAVSISHSLPAAPTPASGHPAHEPHHESAAV